MGRAGPRHRREVFAGAGCRTSHGEQQALGRSGQAAGCREEERVATSAEVIGRRPGSFARTNSRGHTPSLELESSGIRLPSFTAAEMSVRPLIPRPTLYDNPTYSHANF